MSVLIWILSYADMFWVTWGWVCEFSLDCRCFCHTSCLLVGDFEHNVSVGRGLWTQCVCW